MPNKSAHLQTQMWLKNSDFICVYKEVRQLKKDGFDCKSSDNFCISTHARADGSKIDKYLINQSAACDPEGYINKAKEH